MMAGASRTHAFFVTEHIARLGPAARSAGCRGNPSKPHIDQALFSAPLLQLRDTQMLGRSEKTAGPDNTRGGTQDVLVQRV